MTGWAVVAWFLGVPGLLLGAGVGTLNLKLRGVLREAWAIGSLLGVVAGGVLSVVFWRDVAGSSSSTAAIGLLFVPFPPITNGIAGGWAAIIARERRGFR
jgi:disulfide bond formation protein DsbB